MYIAETLINPLFTDVAFRRDREGDGSGHYEFGGVMSPPSLVASARLALSLVYVQKNVRVTNPVYGLPLLHYYYISPRTTVPIIHCTDDSHSWSHWLHSWFPSHTLLKPSIV